MEKNIKDILVVFITEKKKLLSYETDDNQYKLIINRIENRNIAAHEREKINSSKGTWFFTADEQQIVYGVLTNNDYPERFAYQMIYELILELKKFTSIQTEDQKKLSNFCNPFIKNLINKYESPEKMSKINQAMNVVDDTKILVEKNLKKIYDNSANLEDIEQKADKLNQNANQFHKQSKDLASIMYWRNMKMKIISVIVVLSILLYIIVPIIISASKK